MIRRAKPVLATAAIALSLAACQWMGGGEQQQAAGYPGESPAGGESAAAPSQQYPQMAAAAQARQQPASVSRDFVQRVQRQLGERGYDAGPVDGVWGESTRSALRNFQRDQGLAQSGQIDQQTLAALGMDAQGPQMGQRQRQGAAMPGRQQRLGQMQSVSPDLVRSVQSQLDDRGYDTGRIDGIWGRNTQQALSEFQRDQDMNPTGRLDRQTLAALGMDAQGQELGQQPEPGGELPQRQRQQQEQLGETPPPAEEESGLGLFGTEPDIGPEEAPQ